MATRAVIYIRFNFKFVDWRESDLLRVGSFEILYASSTPPPARKPFHLHYYSSWRPHLSKEPTEQDKNIYTFVYIQHSNQSSSGCSTPLTNPIGLGKMQICLFRVLVFPQVHLTSNWGGTQWYTNVTQTQQFEHYSQLGHCWRHR